ncbi:MAG: GIY-YIG nuclease family protein, partial [Chloroflexota bacterium]
MPYCYILECSDGTLYTGWTTDLERRVKVHNAGHGSKYTRLRRPVRLVYSERLRDRSAAQKRELAIKRLPRAKKIALITASSANATPRRSSSRRTASHPGQRPTRSLSGGAGRR